MAETTVPTPDETGPKGAEKIWRAAVPTPTGRDGQPRQPTPRVLLGQLFGRKNGHPDTRAAAERLGVSQRTVQRWIKDRKLPERSPGAQRAREAHETWQDSPEGRQAALGRKNRDRLASTKVVSIRADVRISKSRGMRTSDITLTGADQEALDELIGAMALGDDTLALQRLEDLLGPAFGGSLEIEDLHRIEFK